ncbi:MAG: ATP-dependent sacrificial sulfur transferase LarE [Planctomycetia bacterium]|nr:ATP-dependent sacrificial sulfur transferase LarE [Planctomycetia bacterium]
MATSQQKQEALWGWFSQQKRKIAIAFSGGVDSSVLAKSAVLAFEQHFLSELPLAILAVSPTVSSQEVQEAQQTAKEISIPLLIVPTDELNDRQFIKNDPQRCYFCKKRRFSLLLRHLKSYDPPNDLDHSYELLEGTNADDSEDYRPGYRAVQELKIISPFLDLKIKKSEIREWAIEWGLSVAQKPSNPCLATRIAYGLKINEERLRRIEKAESFLRSLHFNNFRVRMDSDLLARIEVPDDQFHSFAPKEIRNKIIKFFKELNFQFISVDLEAFRSGKMNQF